MKLFENTTNIETESICINEDAKKMYLIICEMLENFNDSKEDYFKLYIFDTLRTFTEILLDYILRISNSSDKLLKEYQSLIDVIRTAENKSEKDEKNVSEN